MSASVRDIAKKMVDVVFKDSYASTLEKMFKYKTVRPGKLVGTDQFGNKFYEAPADGMELRSRWVEFSGKKSQFNATRLSPEWHTWLTRVDEVTPFNKIPFEQQPYALQFRPTELSHMAQKANYVPSGYHCKAVDVAAIKYEPQKYSQWDPTKKIAQDW